MPTVLLCRKPPPSPRFVSLSWHHRDMLHEGTSASVEFSPGDIQRFAKWLGWLSPPHTIHNDTDLLERETWFWVGPDTLQALHDSLNTAALPDDVPILLPEDLPSPDGLLLMSNFFLWSNDDLSHPKRVLPDAHTPSMGNTTEMGLTAVRWTTLDDALLLQVLYGTTAHKLHDAARRWGSDRGREDVGDYDGPFTPAINPTTWRDVANDDTWFGHAPHNCSDASPLCLKVETGVVWPWARRLRVNAKDGFGALFAKVGNDSPLRQPRPPELISLPTSEEERDLALMPPLTASHSAAMGAWLLYSLWAFAAEPLPSATPRAVMRDIPKSRRSPQPDGTGGLRVVVLREAGSSVDSEPDHSLRKRPRRHLVRGHWRHQWHPSLETHRLRWIAPHLRAGRKSDFPTADPPRIVRSVQAPEPQEASTALSLP